MCITYVFRNSLQAEKDGFTEIWLLTYFVDKLLGLPAQSFIVMLSIQFIKAKQVTGVF